MEILVRYMPHSASRSFPINPIEWCPYYESLLDYFRPTARRNAYSSPHNSGCNARVMCAGQPKVLVKNDQVSIWKASPNPSFSLSGGMDPLYRAVATQAQIETNSETTHRTQVRPVDPKATSAVATFEAMMAQRQGCTQDLV